MAAEIAVVNGVTSTPHSMLATPVAARENASSLRENRGWPAGVPCFRRFFRANFRVRWRRRGKAALRLSPRIETKEESLVQCLISGRRSPQTTLEEVTIAVP
jgi:hypothetical protein